METMEKEKIRETVRERYGSIAKAGNDAPESGSAASCCSTSEIKNNALPSGVMLRGFRCRCRARGILLRRGGFFR